MRSIGMVTTIALGLAGSASAQQPAPAVPIELKLSPQDQSDLRGICVLAMRSPQITDNESVLAIADFCVRLRNFIAIANAHAKANMPPEPKPKE